MTQPSQESAGSSRRPIVQISLDLTSIEEALDQARKAVRAGVDWLEAGTPLILAEGLKAVQALRREFPQHPIVADLKTMDGGYLEAEMMAKAGATHVVVMARAHPATLKVVVKAGRDYGVKVMGDDLACEDKPAAAAHDGRIGRRLYCASCWLRRAAGPRGGGRPWRCTAQPTG